MRFARRRSRGASRASQPSPAPPRPCTRSRTRGRSRRSRCRSGSMPKRELRSVAGVETIGAYTLLRLDRGGIDPGVPGQFFMLEAPGRLLPRALSLCLAPRGELAFLLEAVGPGTEALCALQPGDRIHVFGPLGNGFRLGVERPLLVGGGIGMAPLPYLAERIGNPPVVLGFRSAHHAEAAVLLPGAEVVVDPVLVTSCTMEGYDVLA